MFIKNEQKDKTNENEIEMIYCLKLSHSQMSSVRQLDE
jgi:hypothetical protein